jgi:hypothetical protein
MRYMTRYSSVFVSPIFLSSGIALLAHIYLGLNLRNALFLVSLSMFVPASALWSSLPIDTRRELLRLTRIGSISGLVATATYDVVRYMMVRAGDMSIDPFKAFKFFGSSLLAGSGINAPVLAVGSLFHVLNGVCFGIAYTLAWGRSGARGGLLWALSLELLMVNAYPRWLGLDISSEFLAASIVGHAAYGVVLGTLAKRMI